MPKTQLATTIDGSPRKYSAAGGYPLFYWNSRGEILCPGCAQKICDDIWEGEEYADRAPIPNPVVNWEDPNLYCDECETRIENAY